MATKEKLASIADSTNKAVKPNMKFSSLSGGRTNEKFPGYGAVGNTQTTTPQMSILKDNVKRSIPEEKNPPQIKRDEIRKNHVPEHLLKDYDANTLPKMPDISIGGALKSAKDKLFGKKATTTKTK